MSRRSLLFLALAGCGFAPALGSGGAARGLIGTVQASAPGDLNDFAFVRRIEDRLGRPQTVRYDLTYAITTTARSAGITADGAITRFILEGRADWGLLRHDDGQRMAGGTEDSFTGYSATGTTVAGQTAEEDAARRLMVILADQIVQRLLASAASFAP